MQPRRPQVQRAPSISTTTWPISPAPPRPVHGLPSRIRPPPTPVPQKTPSSELYEPPGAQLELGVGRDLHVVADRHATAERAFELLGQRERAFPAREVARARHVAVLDRARRADADARERAPAPARPPWRRRAARSPSPRRRPPARPSVGVGRRAEPSTLLLLVDDRRLDLGPTEVDPAVAGHLRGSSQSADCADVARLKDKAGRSPGFRRI